MNKSRIKTPFHLWFVGILAVLWNAVGAYDYTATQYRMESFMSQFTPEQLEYFYGFPAWMDAAWAIAVWGSLLASFGLLMRKAWSASLFGIAVFGLAATSVYSGLVEVYPITGIEAIWSVVALQRFFTRHRAEELDGKPAPQSVTRSNEQ